jgi:hypothetical protein
LLNGISSITRIGFTACICAGSSLNSQPKIDSSGLSIELACTIQVDAFWSNSDQNGVIMANTIRMRSTARTPSTASSVWMPRARSSCIDTPMPPNASSSTSAVQAAITKPHDGVMHSEITRRHAPAPATIRPGRDWPPRASRAVRATLLNESGFGAAGGTCTYFLRPAQNTSVAIAIRMPGMPKATAGP